jgi:uncharacterized protein (DUF2141 family)
LTGIKKYNKQAVLLLNHTMFTLIFLMLFYAPETEKATLSVEINGLRSDKGTVILRLWEDKNTWLKKEGVLVKAKANIVNGRSVYEFVNVKPGRYALAFVHDENDNGHLDFNFAKIPKEGTGASNNASGTFGPPKFDDAAFDLKAGEKKKMQIGVKYYL